MKASSNIVLMASLMVGIGACGSSNGAGGTGGRTETGGSPGTGGQGTGGLGNNVATGGSSSTGGSGVQPGSGGISSSGGSSQGGNSAGANGGSGGATAGGTGGAASGGANGGASAGGRNGGGNRGTAGSPGVGGANSGGGNTGGAANPGATLVPDPSWTCGMPDGIPPPTAGTLVFTVNLTLGAIHDVGTTQFGERRQLDVKGGQISGDRLQGTVLTGGLDYELTLSTGAMEIEEINIVKASDGTTFFMRNCGVAAPGDKVARVVLDIEVATSNSANAWLNTAKLVATRVVDTSKIQLDVYDVSKAATAGTKVQLKDPAGVPNVSWDCLGGSGSKGNSVFTENVTLGSSLSISGAKRGSRNIIPITGGTTTGKVSGAILNGGADYQLAATGGSTTLDARYTLAPSDGEFIIVRNCGPINTLVPVFEARADGPYAFLNQGKFLSSAPGSGAGGVSITFYERN